MSFQISSDANTGFAINSKGECTINGETFKLLNWSITPPKSHTQTTDFGGEGFKDFVKGVSGKISVTLDEQAVYSDKYLQALHNNGAISDSTFNYHMDRFMATRQPATPPVIPEGCTYTFEKLRDLYREGKLTQLQFIEAVNKLQTTAATTPQATKETKKEFIEALQTLRNAGLITPEEYLSAHAKTEKTCDDAVTWALAAQKKALGAAKKKASGFGGYLGGAAATTTSGPIKSVPPPVSSNMNASWTTYQQHVNKPPAKKEPAPIAEIGEVKRPGRKVKKGGSDA